MKTAIQLTALISTLVTIFLLGLWAASHFTETPPLLAFLLLLMAGLCANVWLIIREVDSETETFELTKSIKSIGFYPTDFGHPDCWYEYETDVVNLVFEARQPDESSFTMEITRIAKLEPVFASVSLHTASEDHWYDFTLHDTFAEAETALATLESGVA